MIEVGLSVPIIDYEGSGVLAPDQDAGFGNPEVSVKFAVPGMSELFSVAAYTSYKIPWAEDGVIQPRRLSTIDPSQGSIDEEDFGEWNLGVAVGLNMSIFHAYGNLAFVNVEQGTQAFRYRAGVELRPFDMLGVAIYYDGIEIEGSVGSTGLFGWNVTAYIAEFFFASLGHDMIVHDQGIDENLTRGNVGDDVTGHTITVAVGATF
jgi:hypothetical protein